MSVLKVVKYTYYKLFSSQHRERFTKGQSKSEKPGQSQIVLCHAKESALCPVDKKRVREGGIPFI